ncbi:MAG: DUF6893 family small protein [Mycobacteriales bacterium]
MRKVGVLATTVVGVATVGALAMGLRSIPDIKRYLKMRAM